MNNLSDGGCKRQKSMPRNWQLNESCCHRQVNREAMSECGGVRCNCKHFCVCVCVCVSEYALIEMQSVEDSKAKRHLTKLYI
uniref:Uncharacterized protein n=1 Tax=Anopheles atroparvus TaxID=41427 RepID=A0AAG5CQA7_ANOAO